MTLFKDTSSLNVASARFTQYFGLEPALEANDPGAVQVMMRFGNGDPAFVERHVELGRVIVAASSAGASWNQLPLKPSYVPMIYQLLFYLGQGAASHRNIAQEEALFLALPLSDANKPVRVITPEGRVSTQNSTLDARGVTFRLRHTQQAGVYKIAVQNSATQDAFAVNLPTTESDLTPSDPATAIAQAGVPANRVSVANTAPQLQASVSRARYGTEVWRALLLTVLGLLFVEIVLAQQFGRRG